MEGSPNAQELVVRLSSDRSQLAITKQIFSNKKTNFVRVQNFLQTVLLSIKPLSPHSQIGTQCSFFHLVCLFLSYFGDTSLGDEMGFYFLLSYSNPHLRTPNVIVP